MTIKPRNPTIIINGDVYVKQPDKSYLEVSIYINAFKQRRVTVLWTGFYKTWRVELIGRFLHTDDLSIPIETDDKIVPTYLTEKQNDALGKVIEDVLLKIIK